MADQKHIQTLVEQAVTEALTNFIPTLREKITQRVLETLAQQPSAPVATTAADSALLNATQAAVQAGTTQVQILDAMIYGADNFAARTALFVVRGANAVGWRARGFQDDEAVKTSPLELSDGLAAQALSTRCPVSGPSSEFMPGFSDRFGASKEHATVYPLVVRDKVVAVIYADGGSKDHHFDRPAMEALVRSTALWLEVFATRKVSGTVATPEPPAPAVVTPATPQHQVAMAAIASVAPPAIASGPAPVPSFAAAAASTTVTAAAAVATLEAPPEVEMAPIAVPAPVVAPASKDDEIHTKARRFAKLLVDEIRLYNQAKVSEGKRNHDLYDRLKDDIEKSRASYEKRYGNSAAKDSNYFNQELIRILADNDPTLFGGNFQRS